MRASNLHKLAVKTLKFDRATEYVGSQLRLVMNSLVQLDIMNLLVQQL